MGRSRYARLRYNAHDSLNGVVAYVFSFPLYRLMTDNATYVTT